MCGIAGLIYRNGAGASSHEIGLGMTRMLQAMKHRGPDSTGFALYGPESGDIVMRYKLADANTPRDFEFPDRLRRHRRDVESRLAGTGAKVKEIEEETEYAFRVTFEYGGDVKGLADLVEDVPDAEVLSIGRSLEIIKDLGDAEQVSGQYDLAEFIGTHAIGHVRMATESDVDISGAHPYWGVPLYGHGGRAQRAAHQLLPVAPPARACRAPLPVRVRLGGHRRLPGREDERRSLAGGGHASEPRGVRRGLHVHVRHRGRARRGQGRAGGQTARALRIGRAGRSRLRGDRDFAR